MIQLMRYYFPSIFQINMELQITSNDSQVIYYINASVLDLVEFSIFNYGNKNRNKTKGYVKTLYTY